MRVILVVLKSRVTKVSLHSVTVCLQPCFFSWLFLLNNVGAVRHFLVRRLMVPLLQLLMKRWFVFLRRGLFTGVAMQQMRWCLRGTFLTSYFLFLGTMRISNFNTRNTENRFIHVSFCRIWKHRSSHQRRPDLLYHLRPAGNSLIRIPTGRCRRSAGDHLWEGHCQSREDDCGEHF